jgi:hypothetical protein
MWRALIPACLASAVVLAGCGSESQTAGSVQASRATETTHTTTTAARGRSPGRGRSRGSRR